MGTRAYAIRCAIQAKPASENDAVNRKRHEAMLPHPRQEPSDRGVGHEEPNDEPDGEDQSPVSVDVRDADGIFTLASFTDFRRA